MSPATAPACRMERALLHLGNDPHSRWPGARLVQIAGHRERPARSRFYFLRKHCGRIWIKKAPGPLQTTRGLSALGVARRVSRGALLDRPSGKQQHEQLRNIDWPSCYLLSRFLLAEPSATLLPQARWSSHLGVRSLRTQHLYQTKSSPSRGCAQIDRRIAIAGWNIDCCSTLRNLTTSAPYGAKCASRYCALCPDQGC